MYINLVTLLISISVIFCAQQNNARYTSNYNDSEKLINVSSNIIHTGLSEKLNQQYTITPDFLIENGIAPFTTYYMIQESKEYSANIEILESYIIENINIELDDELLNSNILSNTLNMRGVNLLEINVYPILYNQDEQTLTMIKTFDVIIDEFDVLDDYGQSYNPPISLEFEKLLSNMVINLDLSDRLIETQPSILYICGGSSISNSYLQDLIQWRKEQGYKVYSVSTSDIGSSFNAISDYISDAYFNWEFPPEYVILVGDTSGSYQVPYSSASGGSSDYPYSLIQGGDLLPEVIIGRISASSSSELSNIINKTIAYEKATYIDFTGTDWYESSALVGDPSSTGNSAIITNEYIENILNVYNFEDVGTCYSCGSYSSWMQNRLQEGILYFNYRGYIGTSGFGSNNINNANNGYMTPFATFITCATGDFNGTSIAESFIKAGSLANPKGAVAAVGTATSSTHTVPNNIVDMGIYDGIFAKGVSTAGGALVSGKMALHSTYPQDPYSMTYKFTHWNNLMGDPTLNLWTDTPSTFNVDYNNSISMGSDLLEFYVIDDQGNDVHDARIVLYVDDDNVYETFSNESGYANIQINELTISDVKVTILKKNFIPHSGNISIINEDIHLEYKSELLVINDDLGINDSNPNGLANSGETVQLYMYLENLSDSNFSSSSFIETSSDKIEIISDGLTANNLVSSETSLVGPFELYLNQDIISTDDTDLILRVINNENESEEWTFNVPFNVLSPNVIINSINYSSDFNPGDAIEMFIEFENIGTEAIENANATISINNSLVEIYDSVVNIGSISPAQTSLNTEPFYISFSDDIIDGSLLSFNLNIANEYGYSQNIVLENISVGVASQNDPLGPDSYGYYIYDWTDVGYSLTPFYDWIELDPSQGGDGVDLGISHSGNGNGSVANSTKYVDLPFTFTFYGEDYDQISVSANGWISFGYSNMESFRNYQLPGAGGPSPMVAAFWDDLKTTGASKVLKYISDEYVIIEWLNMETYQYGDNQTFQVILYNSITPSGDDEIKIQYKEFNNTTNGDYSQYTPYHGCYSTIGIENHMSTDGIEYTFNNNYPTAAAPLQNQSAIFITTRNTTVLNAGDVNQDDEVNILDIVMVINHILMIESLDSVGQFVSDMDENQSINILDVILMINLIFES